MITFTPLVRSKVTGRVFAKRAVFDDNTAFSKRLATCEQNIKGLQKASDGAQPQSPFLVDCRWCCTVTVQVAPCSVVATANVLICGPVLSMVIPRAALLGISEKTLGQPLPQVRATLVWLTSCMYVLLAHTCAYYVHVYLTSTWHKEHLTRAYTYAFCK